MKHLLISDTQVSPGVPTEHIAALGKYIVAIQPEKIICIGDFADMPSLSSYETAGSTRMEGARYAEDIASSCAAMEVLLSPMWKYNKRQIKNKKKKYSPKMIMLVGNHEHRIDRAIQKQPTKLQGIISLDDLKYKQYGWDVVPFLEVHEEDGVLYSHYFSDPNGLTGRSIGGSIDNKLQKLKRSFTMGHQQGLQYGVTYDAMGKPLHGLVSGSFYMHDEHYMSPQANKQHWRGCVLKNNVQDGKYDASFLSLEYLLTWFREGKCQERTETLQMVRGSMIEQQARTATVTGADSGDSSVMEEETLQKYRS